MILSSRKKIPLILLKPESRLCICPLVLDFRLSIKDSSILDRSSPSSILRFAYCTISSTGVGKISKQIV